MKRSNKLMRAAGVLLVCTLVTSSFVGGTFAKYVSKAEAADTARVAKWGVTISNGNEPGENGVYSGDAFYSVYHGDVVESVKSGNGDRVIAPGTNGTFKTLKITGTPEVAVKIETEVDVELTGDWVDENGTFYCPLVFTINGVRFDAGNLTSADEFETALENTLREVTNTDEDQVIPAGTDLSGSDGSSDSLPALFQNWGALTWEWPYHTSDEYDVKDTYLGDIAAGVYEDKTAPNIEITFTTTVTQVD